MEQRATGASVPSRDDRGRDGEPPADGPSAERAGRSREWLGRWGLISGALLFGLALAGGLLDALIVDGHPPGVRLGYGDHVNDLLRLGEAEQALSQMRMAALIEGSSPDVRETVLPQMAGLARSVGDAESEAFALRRLARARPREAELRSRLARLLISDPKATEEELLEAERASLEAVRLVPEAAEAHGLAAASAWRLGREDVARERLSASPGGAARAVAWLGGIPGLDPLLATWSGDAAGGGAS